MDTVAAVRDLDNEVAAWPHLDGFAARQAVSAVGIAHDGITLRQTPYGNSVERIDLHVVDAQDTRREVVRGADNPFADDVVEPLRRGVADLKVQVQPARRAAVARVADHVDLLHGPDARLDPEAHPVRMAGVMLRADRLLNVVAETLQMAVDGRCAVAQREYFLRRSH